MILWRGKTAMDLNSSLIIIIKRYFTIDQHLVRHFVNYGIFQGPFLSMRPNNYPLLQFIDLHQSGNRIEILVNCGISIVIPLILFYYRIFFYHHSFIRNLFISHFRSHSLAAQIPLRKLVILDFILVYNLINPQYQQLLTKIKNQ